MTQVRTRVIHLKTPLEVTNIGTVYKPFPVTYTVTAIRIHASGVLDAVVYDWVGLSVGPSSLRQGLAQEAVRVLGMNKTIDRTERPRPRRRRRNTGLIPDVWGLRFRSVG